MNVQQMTTVKRWLVEHRTEAPVEYHAWDAMLTLWMLGWMGVPPTLLLHTEWLLPLCLSMFCAPSLYVRARQRLHQRGRLRCDWLALLQRR